MRVAAMRVAAMRVAAMRVAAMRVVDSLVAGIRVLVTPGFPLTSGTVEVAFFGVLLPLIKDFFWIAIFVSPICRFFTALIARSCTMHGPCQTQFRRLKVNRDAESMQNQ
jgi:hypothetical protein